MSTKETLAALGIHPKKGKGQNFLSDPGFAASILRFSQVQPQDAVLEIGPGLGILTGLLINSCSRLVLVELEERFCEYLSGAIAGLKAEQIICADIRDLSAAHIREKLSSERFAVLSNVPYVISS